MDAFVTRNFLADERVNAYVAAHSSPPSPLVGRLRQVTAERVGYEGMQVGDDQALLLEMLTRATGARDAIEVGTFTGTSAQAIARGLPPGGRLICCDVSEEFTAIAREHWAEVGLADRIELRLGPALETLRALPPEAGFDLVFIDADKENYAAYYAELVERLRPGGLLLADNTLWSGRVVDAAGDDTSTAALQAFNDLVAADDRVLNVLLPVFDGLLVVQRRPEGR